jgi:hypothetical protein
MTLDKRYESARAASDIKNPVSRLNCRSSKQSTSQTVDSKQLQQRIVKRQ